MPTRIRYLSGNAIGMVATLEDTEAQNAIATGFAEAYVEPLGTAPPRPEEPPEPEAMPESAPPEPPPAEEKPKKPGKR